MEDVIEVLACEDALFAMAMAGVLQDIPYVDILAYDFARAHSAHPAVDNVFLFALTNRVIEGLLDLAVVEDLFQTLIVVSQRIPI